MIIQDKIYGEFEIKDELVKAIINTKAMQRLKGIDQHCGYAITRGETIVSRFDHSIGVYLLLKKLNAPFEEQIAGLIHDVAHTAFSHIVDYVYEQEKTQGYHENFHEEIIKNSEIPALLKKHNLDINYILDEKNFPLLEKEIPDLCVDRIDYFLRDMDSINKSDMQKTKEYIEAFIVLNNGIIIKNKELARKIADDFMEMNLEFWGLGYHTHTSHIIGEALRLALKHNIIKEEDFFLEDKEVMEKINSSNNKEVLDKLATLKGNFSDGTEKDYDFHGTTKARFIDPKFLENREVKRLSEVDEEFKQKVEEFKRKYEKGFYLKLEI
ncbi:MAG: HD domain-containing protein [Candidatus Woesearchaeota archaeon]